MKKNEKRKLAEELVQPQPQPVKNNDITTFDQRY